MNPFRHYRFFPLIFPVLLCIFFSSLAYSQERLENHSRESQDSLRLIPLIKNSQKGSSAGKPTSFQIPVGDTLLRSPWGAVLRSALLPGLGQMYNGAPKKALVFIGLDVATMTAYQIKNNKLKSIQRDRKDLDREIKDPATTETRRAILLSAFSRRTSDFDKAQTDRNLYGWLFAISYLLGIVDSYVDAHLYLFDEKMEWDYAAPGQIGMKVRW